MNKLFSWIVAIIMGTAAAAAVAQGQSEAFTYQGQLKLHGVPLTEQVDVKYTLFDSEFATTAVAGPLSFDGNIFPAIQVTNGLFSTELDFGPGALQLGQYLEIEVRSPHDPSDANPYTTLMPRQQISAAPFALRVPGLETSATGVEVEGNIHAFGEMTASAFSSNSPLIFKVNPSNSECARFDDANCYLGLGTTMPQARLHIGGVAGVDGLMFPDGSLMTTAAGLGGGGGGFWSAGGANVFNNNGGNVGIGTSMPNHRLRISGGPPWTTYSWGGALELDNASAIGWRSNGAGNRFGIGHTNGGLYFFRTTSDPGTATSLANYDFVISDSGNVGIGAGLNVPASKLDIFASGDGAELLRFSTHRPWVFRQIRSGSVTGLELRSTVGQKAFEITTVEGNNVATFLADGVNSKVGIGTISPTSRLDIVGQQDALGITGYQPFLTMTDNANGGISRARIQNANGGINFFAEAAFATGTPSLSLNHFTTSTHCADFRMGHVTRRGSPGRALVDNGDHLVVNFANDWGYTYVTGRLKTNILEVLGADLAEKFPSSDENVEPGTVMEIDPDHPGKLRVAREAYTARVAGVVSGAGDLPAGAVLGNLPDSEESPSIALSGRVWVRCDAASGAIAPGDFLTSAATPGHAMRACDRSRANGATLGKAMTPLAQGERGLVLVLVNLQ